MYRQTFRFHGLDLKSPNRESKKSWYEYQRKRKECDELVWAASAGRKPEKPLPHAKLVVVRHGVKYLDCDNLHRAGKALVDALIVNGIIASDSWTAIGRWVTDQCLVKHKSLIGWFVTVIERACPPKEEMFSFCEICSNEKKKVGDL